jgi:CheY-like chemotaxis protein
MGKKILFIDDDVDLLEQNKTVLEAGGYEVRTALSGEQGLEEYRQFKPDLVILDLAMETLDAGFIVAHKIRQEEGGMNAKIYILTSAGRDTDFRFSVHTEEERKWIKADGYLEKPIRPSDLLNFIRKKVFHEIEDHNT